jgi:hypothetical protein
VYTHITRYIFRWFHDVIEKLIRNPYKWIFTYIPTSMSYKATSAPPTYAASICIPRAFHKLTWNDVKNAFETAFDAPGCVQKVDLVNRTDDNNRPFKRIFVHFKYWPDNETAAYAMKRMKEENGTFQLVYDEPWYWKCSLSRVAPPTYSATPPKQKASPFVTIVSTDNSMIDSGEESDDGDIDETEIFDTKQSLEEAIRDAAENE